MSIYETTKMSIPIDYGVVGMAPGAAFTTELFNNIPGLKLIDTFTIHLASRYYKSYIEFGVNNASSNDILSD